jgi:hypothetical protein
MERSTVHSEDKGAHGSWFLQAVPFRHLFYTKVPKGYVDMENITWLLLSIFVQTV